LIVFPEEEHSLHIYSLHVSPDFRKRGVGSALLSKCINDMCESNVKEIILDVYRDNTPAYNLYRKFGFY
jgi:ribosomal protein S18 acetylase RimI-like enzyme